MPTSKRVTLAQFPHTVVAIKCLLENAMPEKQDELLKLEVKDVQFFEDIERVAAWLHGKAVNDLVNEDDLEDDADPFCDALEFCTQYDNPDSSTILLSVMHGTKFEAFCNNMHEGDFWTDYFSNLKCTCTDNGNFCPIHGI